MGSLAQLDNIWCHLRFVAKRPGFWQRLALAFKPLETVEHNEGWAYYKQMGGVYYLFRLDLKPDVNSQSHSQK